MRNGILYATYHANLGVMDVNSILSMALLMFLLLTGQPQRDIDLNIPAAHPAEAFETIAAMRIASNSLALVIDADGVVWHMATDGDDDWREQTAPQADAVWHPSWVSFLLDEDGVLLSSGGTLGDPCGVDTGSEQTGYVRDWTPVLENVVALDSISSTTAALQADGTLWAWGQLHGAMSYTPVRVTDGVRSFSYAGYAVKTDNTLYAWSGQLDGDAILCSLEPVMQNVYTVEGDYAIGLDGMLWKLNENQPPQKVMDNVVSVMADGAEIGAIDQSGGLWCWSFDDWSQPRKVADNCAYIVRRALEDVQALLFIDTGNTLNAVYYDGERAGEVIPLEPDVLYAETAYDRTALYVKPDGSLWLIDFGVFEDGMLSIPTGNISPDAPRTKLLDKVKMP